VTPEFGYYLFILVVGVCIGAAIVGRAGAREKVDKRLSRVTGWVGGDPSCEHEARALEPARTRCLCGTRWWR